MNPTNPNTDNRKLMPPKLAQRFLRWFLRDNLCEEVQGDLEEQFDDTLAGTSLFRAKINYWYQVFNYLRPFAIRKSIPAYHSLTNYSMFKHYVTLSIRNVKKEKIYSLINIIGLTLGVLCSLSIYLWVENELSIDLFNKDIDRMAEVMSTLKETNNTIITYDDTQGLVANAALQQIPEVETACRIMTTDGVLISLDDQSFMENGIAADANLFHFFTFPLLEGDPGTALTGVNNIVISETLARKYFGTTSALGKTLRLNDKKGMMVTAVFKDIPMNSSIRFDFATPVEAYIKEHNMRLTWGNYSFYTYVKLFNAQSFKAADLKFRNLMKNNDPDDDGASWLFLHPLRDVHLYTRFVNGKADGGRIEYVKLFSAAALFILVMACINFVNMFTAQAGQRSREVGVRKVHGAQRSQLITQFLMDSFLFAMLSIILAVGILYLILPSINAWLSIHLELNVNDEALWIALGTTFVFTGLLAGLYPAFVLSAFNPNKVLKKDSGGSANSNLRKRLVTFQFILSALLLICTAVINRQISYIQHKNMGYNRDHVLYFYPHKAGDHFEAFRQELTSNPAILEMGSSNKNPVNVGNSTTSVVWQGKADGIIIEFRAMEVSYDFLKTIQLPIMAGRGFSRSFPVQDSINQYVVTQEAVRRMQLDNPIGQRISLWQEPGIIVGVAKDFNSRSIHTAVDPVIFKLRPGIGSVYVKIDKSKTAKAIQALETAYKKYEAFYPFEYHFLDETFEDQYRGEVFAEKFTIIFSCIAILLSALGLYGLSYFSAEKRKREIGIRKVLGASVSQLLVLLSKETLVLILVANLIAWPLGWYIITIWLDRFAYKVDVGFGTYIGAALMTLLIASGVMISRTLKAAYQNPVNNLRQE